MEEAEEVDCAVPGADCCAGSEHTVNVAGSGDMLVDVDAKHVLEAVEVEAWQGSRPRVEDTESNGVKFKQVQGAWNVEVKQMDGC